MMRSPIFALSLCLTIPGWGQIESMGVAFRSGTNVAKPNVELPPHVVAPEGQLTLFADYAHGAPQGTPLYLVNRTLNKVTFGSQDGDIGLKLEYQRADGKWQRAQVHVNSWCGNSYGHRSLNPGQHFVMPGYRPSGGERALVRYVRNGQPALESNQAEGFYAREDVEAARVDDMSMRTVPDILTRVIPPETRPDQPIYEDRILASLHLAWSLGGALRLKSEGEKLRDKLISASSLSEEQQQFRNELKTLLAMPWGDESDHTALLNRCLKALTAPTDPMPGYGTPELLPDLVWAVIADIGELQAGSYAQVERSPSAIWKQVFDLALLQTATPSREGRYSINRLFGLRSLTNEVVESAAWEKLLVSEDQDLVSMAANALSNRGQWLRLVELGWKLPPASQIAILHALALGQTPGEIDGPDGFGGYRQPPVKSDEELFWKHCIRTYPLKAARALYFSNYASSNGNLKGRVVYAPFLNEQVLLYWMSEMDRADRQNEDFKLPEEEQVYIAAVKALSINDRSGLHGYVDPATKEVVVPLLRRLLSHRGYKVLGTTSRENELGERVPLQKCRFVIRQAAKEVLNQWNEPVPEVIIEVEKEIPQDTAVEPPKSGVKLPVTRRRNLIPVLESTETTGKP